MDISYENALFKKFYLKDKKMFFFLVFILTN